MAMRAAEGEGARETGGAGATADWRAALDAQRHARAVLGPALAGGGASHAYLLHGPAGSGRRAAARALAAALLSEGARNPATVAERVARGTHPDLVWVRASGAAEMLVADVEEPVVAAAARTPFESARRVFVLEGADAMNDQAANRLLKTLEEPPAFTHLLLLAERREDVLATIASRCQQVRFDPLPAAAIARRLAADTDDDDLDGDRVLACARLAMGDAAVAASLAGERGAALRAQAERFVRCALGAQTGERPWLGLLELAREAGARESERAQRELEGELELLPGKERRRYEREAAEAQRRGERRVRTRTLQQGLRLAELWLRDLLCVREGAGELVYAVDRREQLREDAERCERAALERAIALVADTRLSLALNVSEELALEALAYRLQALFSGERAAAGAGAGVA